MNSNVLNNSEKLAVQGQKSDVSKVSGMSAIRHMFQKQLSDTLKVARETLITDKPVEK